MIKITTNRILLIEPENNLARTMRLALSVESQGGFYVEIRNSGKEALALLSEKTFDVVVCDASLLDIDWKEIVRSVRAASKKTPIVLLTETRGNGSPGQLPEGVNGVIVKPFGMLDFLVLVRRVMEEDNQTPIIADNDQVEEGPARSILIMDDDPGLRRIYAKALKKSRYDVKMAATLDEARQLLLAQSFDIFICDIHMGRQRGTDLLTEFSDRLSEIGTQVIMVSAYGQYRFLTEEMGADFFLEKPIALGTLLTLISRLMDHSKVDQPSSPPSGVEAQVQKKNISAPAS